MTDTRPRAPAASPPLTLLLDLDGTLTDPREGIVGCLRHAFLSLGRTPPPDATLARCIGPPLAESFRRLLPGGAGEDAVARAIAHYRERFDAQGWAENRVYPAIPDFLAALRARGWRAFVATSKPAVFATRITRHFSLQPLAGVHGSELDGRRTDKGELIAHVLRVEGLDPALTVMVGDRHHDVRGACANGVAALGVTWGYGSREELRGAGARWLCDDPPAVLRTLDAAFAARAPAEPR